MISCKININKINDISEFVSICVKSPCEVILRSDRYKVSGKSLLGVYSLDLSKNVDVDIEYPNDKNEETLLYEELRKFSVVK